MARLRFLYFFFFVTFVAIIGAGPAGLTAALELLKNTDVVPIVLEESNQIGGIARTINHNGNRMDIGGHRFFSKNEDIMQWWLSMMPLQGAPALDDILTNDGSKSCAKGGPDPEKENRTMLLRRRVSRIFYLNHFFSYPVSLSLDTFRGMGLVRTLKAGCGYLAAYANPRKEKSLEDFYINRFGKQLYSMFFEHYTEKVWGVHPSKLGADWGAQRVSGLSIFKILKTALVKALSSSNDLAQKGTEKSLIERFIYPKLGPGQLWETVAEEIKQRGGQVIMNCKASTITINDGKVTSVTGTFADGSTQTFECDYAFSSMPIKDLINIVKGVEVPEQVASVATSLPYRDFITVGILVKNLKITNNSQFTTYNNRVPDTWIYVQDRNVKIGRLQIFNNWSPYLVADFKDTVWLGLEYFCNEGDELWTMPDADFIKFAAAELAKIGIIASADDVIDSVEVRVKKAYPAYFGSYYQLPTVTQWLDNFHNLFCIGRNGQHRYNNMDHSMLTAINAVNAIKNGTLHDHQPIWNVNTEQDYHEKK